MKISIITICYNAEKTLESALKSVREQDYPDIEHIVIDGASNDGTLAIAERYKEGLAVLVSEKDRGIYDAMNKGIALATGDVIGILNADDYYKHPQVLSRVAAVMQEGGLDALYADVEYFRDDAPDRVVRRYSSRWFHPSRIPYGWMPAHPTLFLKREIYNRFGSFKTDYRIAADYEFIARIFYRTSLKYRYLPEVLVRMRMGGISTGGLKNTMLLNEEVLRACRENSVPTNIFKILSKYPAKLLEFLP